MEILAEKRPSQDRGRFLREIAMGFEKGQIFLTAVELDLFTKLIKPHTSEIVASELGTDPELTTRFLDALVAQEALTKRDGNYCTAPMLASFLQGSASSSASNLTLRREVPFLDSLDLSEMADGR